ncbi:beta-galactosidase trimerization domain-containing protein [bacterium]|nr:beta-galactosidase trimerization domain-containing protein [bacterium]
MRLLIVLCLTLSSAWAEPAVRLFAEAEDFTVERGWEVVPYGENYFASTFAVTFLSRMACLGAPEQAEGVAVQTIRIPSAGNYRVFARYEQPFDFSAEFTLVVEQGGKAVYRETFGRLADEKIWAFNGHERSPMVRYSWGGTDNIVWQNRGAAVRLAAGPATVRLIAAPQLDKGDPRAMAARRHVDVICLTNDDAGLEVQRTKARYLELDGWLVQDGDLFVRFTNPKDGLGPCIPIVRPFTQGQHSPYYVHVRDWPATRVLKSGRLVDAASYAIAGPHSDAVDAKHLAPLLDLKAIPESEYLQPGDTSGWAPMGQVLDSLNNCIWLPAAQYKTKIREVDLEVEFAVPDGKGGLRPVRRTRVRGMPGSLSLVAFEIPGNVAQRPVIRTQLEAVQWVAEKVAAFPKKGRVPKRFPIYNLMGFSSATQQDNALGRAATELAVALGDNTLTPVRSVWCERLGVPKRRAAIVAHWRPGNMDSFRKTVENADKKEQLPHIRIVSYGDEVHIPPAKPDAAKFEAWLRKRGVEPGAFTVKPEDPLYYHSRLWALETGMAHYVEATRWLQERIDPAVLTGANYSPHANYLVTDLQWVRPFKLGAMTMPWSEDYVCQIPEFSVQVVGYLTSAFRAGAKYRKLPIMMYVMPHFPNNTPRDFRLSYYTCIAHGATKINFFCASPLATAYTENYIQTEGLPMWRAVHDVVRETGVFEDYVLDGAVRPARVGLLLSSVDEILTGDTNFKGAIHNAERKAVYFALRHAQAPVDFVTEDDVIDGLAKDLRLIYVTQQFLHAKAVAALARWVEGGGTLVALCGGGFRDEFRKPNPAAERLYGARDGGIEKDPKLTMIQPKQDLPPAKPVDTVDWGGVRVEAIAWKQTLTPTDGKVAATYSDGSPAAVVRQRGRGRAVLVGCLPGLAWQKSGLPLRPVDRGARNADFSHFLPTDMDAGLRRKFVDDLLPEGFVRPVECSVPLVETTCIDSPGRLAVPLMNYTGNPIAALTVRVNGFTRAKAVRSVQQGTLRPVFADGAMTVTLPLDVTDMLLIDR